MFNIGGGIGCTDIFNVIGGVVGCKFTVIGGGPGTFIWVVGYSKKCQRANA